MADKFSNNQKSLDSPADIHFSITPHDTNELSVIPRALFVGGAGTIVITDAAGIDVTYTVPAGSIIPFRAYKVKLTGTSATGIVGWY